jgi:glutathione S-transferase
VPQPIEVHYWPTPNGHKVTIALEELGLPYEIRPINIGAGEQFAPEFLAISPNNRMPAIVDPEGPDGQPVSIFESGAILQHLARKTGKLYGADERGRIDVEQWLFWQVGGLGPMSGQANHFRNYAPAVTRDQRHLAYGAIRYSNETERLYGVMERRLKDREFLAGDYSIADIACWPWITPWKAMGVVMDQFPNLKAWYGRIEAREAVKRALERGEVVKRGPGLQDSSADAEAARRVLFGQRAR